MCDIHRHLLIMHSPQCNDEGADKFQQNELFYENAKEYWAKIDPTIDGMLGGFGQISACDIHSSNQFLKELYKMKPSPGMQNAIDCGAGIGRVTKHLLMPLYQKVDVVEQCSEFTDRIHDYIREPALLEKLGTIYNVGLQNFDPENGKYDLIWCQWVLGHLRDDDFIEFFKKCASGLTAGGMIVIKENVTSSDECCIDRTDSSVTRSLKDTKLLLQKAGLRIVKQIKEKLFISGLFPVYFFACRPMNVK